MGCLVPKSMFIAITLENGTNLILDLEQLKKMIFQNVSCPPYLNAFSLWAAVRTQTMKCALTPVRGVRMKRWGAACRVTSLLLGWVCPTVRGFLQPGPQTWWSKGAWRKYSMLWSKRKSIDISPFFSDAWLIKCMTLCKQRLRILESLFNALGEHMN